MTTPEPTVPGPDRAGVWRLPSTAEAAAAALAGRGWRVGVMAEVADRAECLHAIGRALGFGDYYGQNLDALDECLGDLEAPTALVWPGWERLAVERPGEWAAVMEVLADRAAASPAFALVLV